MEQKTKIEKSCKNCCYYSQHYTKQGTRYHTVFCGHCLNRNNKKMKPVFCELWEDMAILKEERRQSIKEVLIDMSDRLNEIALILKDDTEQPV